MLAKRLAKNERSRAKYMAFAFNDPSVLFDEEETKQSCNIDDLLADCNG
ncbi:MAG: hypothetical protein RR370_01080 [Synergistaceae bacterium]